MNRHQRQAAGQAPVALETNLEYRRAVHEVIDTEPQIEGWEVMYGELEALGIVKATHRPTICLERGRFGASCSGKPLLISTTWRL